MTNALFHIVDGAEAVLKRGGVYYQAKVFKREDHLFAKFGGGYIRLIPKHGGTSLPHVALLAIDGVDGSNV